VLQIDTDTIWQHDPFPMLRLMAARSSIVVMKDIGLANAGIIFARPGSADAQRLLDDVAWRVQLLQNHPEVIPRLVPFTKALRPPFYANSDDQSLLNDVIVSAVLRNATFLGSTARYEAKNKYNTNPDVPVWETLPESKLHSQQLRQMHRKGRSGVVAVPWARDGERTARYTMLPIADNDSVALAPRALFAHLPFAHSNAITHLTAARGFKAKVKALQRLGRWHPEGLSDSSTPLRPHHSATVGDRGEASIDWRGMARKWRDGLAASKPIAALRG